MDDTHALRFFTQPTHTYHRQYEALRAVIVERRSQQEVAESFGYSYGTLRHLVLHFRRQCDVDMTHCESLFFRPNKQVARSKTRKKRTKNRRLRIAKS